MQTAFNRRQAIGVSLGVAGCAVVGWQPASAADKEGADKFQSLMKVKLKYKGSEILLRASIRGERVYFSARMADGKKLGVYSLPRTALNKEKVKGFRISLKEGKKYTVSISDGKVTTDVPGLTIEEPEYQTQGLLGDILGAIGSALLLGAAVAIGIALGIPFIGSGLLILGAGLVIALVGAISDEIGGAGGGSFRAEPGLEEEPGVWY